MKLIDWNNFFNVQEPTVLACAALVIVIGTVAFGVLLILASSPRWLILLGLVGVIVWSFWYLTGTLFFVKDINEDNQWNKHFEDLGK